MKVNDTIIVEMLIRSGCDIFLIYLLKDSHFIVKAFQRFYIRLIISFKLVNVLMFSYNRTK